MRTRLKFLGCFNDCAWSLEGANAALHANEGVLRQGGDEAGTRRRQGGEKPWSAAYFGSLAKAKNQRENVQQKTCGKPDCQICK